ncbi:hypothetical protein FLLO111716_11820 [Flavobacterium longum]|uniref:hypothetical protein n=1 Tax=Flavobacterium longum TaxID=1299340 RepID=UPI0039EAB6E8
MEKILAVIFCFFLTQGLWAQEYEFLGLLKFNQTTMISYRLVFTEHNGKIEGFSVTDLQGENETKNRISGTYDRKSKVFKFDEMDIEYTKSVINTKDFCYLHFTGKIELTDKSRIKGKFRGLFQDGKECVNGSLELIGSAKAYERINKMEKRIKKFQNSKKATPELKQPVDLAPMVEKLKVNTLRKNEKTTVYLRADKVDLTIWDGGKEDGDKVSIVINGKPFLENYTVTNAKKTMSITLDRPVTMVKIEAIGEGAAAPNTSRLSFAVADQSIDLTTDLKEGDTTTVQIIKK